MRAAVLGSPIAHSLSPVLHRAAYAYLGLDWEYDARVCDEAGLPALLAGLGPDWAGLSLTMPLKSAIVPLLDEVDPIARQCGAVNTVVLRAGHLAGFNTDVPGLVAALAERGVAPTGVSAVLGGGATARSAVLSLAQAGWQDIVVYARRVVTAQWLHAALPAQSPGAGTRLSAQDLSPGQVGAALGSDLVVSTLPAGAGDPFVEMVPAAPGTLFDVVYDPWPTELAAAWSGRAGAVIGGLDLLVHQGALQVVLMTGTDVAVAELVTVMRAAGEAALGASAG